MRSIFVAIPFVLASVTGAIAQSETDQPQQPPADTQNWPMPPAPVLAPQGYVMVPIYMMAPGQAPMPGMAPFMMSGDHGGKPHGDRWRIGDDRPQGHHRGKGWRGHGPMMQSIFAKAMEDGQISQEEFETAAAAMFEELDADGDGAVTRDELRNRAAGKFRKGRPQPEGAPTEAPKG